MALMGEPPSYLFRSFCSLSVAIFRSFVIFFVSHTFFVYWFQILTLQASNLTSEDLSLTVLAPASFTSPPSVVSLNSTPTSPISPFLGFSEFTERVQTEKRNTTTRKVQSLPSIPLETRTENTNDEMNPSSDVVPKSGLGCTHLWLQSRVPLG